ncbi:MAG: ATP-dependent sacrificial sulfur transferase LarE [Candidatus Methanospirareceae archaeon]
MLGKFEELKERIRGKGKILVAFSGGVDSGLLLKIAHDLLGENVFAVILDAEIMPRSEIEFAKRFVKEIGCRYEVVKFGILSNDMFIKNTRERCYYCKKESSLVLKKIASVRGIKCIADGLNLSDFEGYRPGIRASDEEGIWHPFVEVGLTKGDIREIARGLGVKFWDKPSSSCLATRIAYGEEITKEKLSMIEFAEEILRKKGFKQVRVRLHGNIARIEVEKEEIWRVVTLKEEIVGELKRKGFRYITVDLQGYRSGSMDEGN